MKKTIKFTAAVAMIGLMAFAYMALTKEVLKEAE